MATDKTNHGLNAGDGTNVRVLIERPQYPRKDSWEIEVGVDSGVPPLWGCSFLMNNEYTLICYRRRTIDEDESDEDERKKDEVPSLKCYIIEKIQDLETLQQVLIQPNEDSGFFLCCHPISFERDKGMRNPEALRARLLACRPTPYEDARTSQWLVDTTFNKENVKGSGNVNFLTYRRENCIWEFRREIKHVNEQNTVIRGFFIFKPNSTLDIWYDLETQPKRQAWRIEGCIPNIKQSELSQIRTWPIEKCRDSHEYIYRAFGQSRRETALPWLEWSLI